MDWWVWHTIKKNEYKWKNTDIFCQSCVELWFINIHYVIDQLIMYNVSWTPLD